MCGTPKTGGSGNSCIDMNINNASTSSGTSGHVAGNLSNTCCSGSNVKANYVNNNNNIHNIIYNNNNNNNSNLKHKGNNGDKVNDTVSSNNSLNKQQQPQNIYQLG